MVHLKDALAVPADRAAAHPGGPYRRARRCSSRRPSPSSRCWSGCAVSSPSPSSSTSTAARQASSPWRTSSRRSSARYGTSTTGARRLPELARPRADAAGRPAWEADGGCRVGALRGASAWRCPRARTRRWPASSPTCSGASPRPATPHSCGCRTRAAEGGPDGGQSGSCGYGTWRTTVPSGSASGFHRPEARPSAPRTARQPRCARCGAWRAAS